MTIRDFARLSFPAFFAAAVASSAWAEKPSGTPSPRLSRSHRANEVLQNLKDRIPSIAAANRRSVEDVQHLLASQADLWVDPDLQLFYVCDGLTAHDAATLSSGETADHTALVANTDAFQLHSLPGAKRVVYLDFDGHVTSGTAWNMMKTGGADIVSAPFDFDGNPTNWSADEKARITRIWQRVAEDFMPFGVDVTTQDPGLEALRKSSDADESYGVRVVISPSSSWYGNAGGTAYLGSFNWNDDTPTFVFSDKLGPNNEKYIAEATSHEVGHTLGLSHDGKTDGTSYYGGHGTWAPIMGVGYSKAVTQWSKGEYALANNLEDDLAIMPYYGAAPVGDDVGNTRETAKLLNGTSVLAVGLIETRADVDFYRFNAGSGAISLTLSGIGADPNLDIKADLLNASGVAVATSDLAGLGATLSANIPGGTYYLRIEGVGFADPLTTGYSDYASIGEYKISGSIPAVSGAVPVAVASANTLSGAAPVAVVFSSAGSNDADGTIASYAWNFGDGTNSNLPNPEHVFSAPGTYTVSLTVTDNVGLAGNAELLVTVAPAANLAPVAKAEAPITSGPAPLNVAFSSAGSFDQDGKITAYHWAFGDGSTSTLANPGKVFSNAGSFVAKLTVADDKGASSSTTLTITVAQPTLRQFDVSAFSVSTGTTGTATASAKLMDAQGRPVQGATLTVTWSGAITGSTSAVTNASGDAVFTSKRAKGSGQFTVNIGKVVAPADATYLSTLFSAPTTASGSVRK